MSRLRPDDLASTVPGDDFDRRPLRRAIQTDPLPARRVMRIAAVILAGVFLTLATIGATVVFSMLL